MENKCKLCGRQTQGEFGKFYYGIISNLASPEEKSKGCNLKVGEDDYEILGTESSFFCNDCISISRKKSIKNKLINFAIFGALLVLIVYFSFGQSYWNIPDILWIIFVYLIIPAFTIRLIVGLFNLSKMLIADEKIEYIDKLAIAHAVTHPPEESIKRQYWKYWTSGEFDKIGKS